MVFISSCETTKKESPDPSPPPAPQEKITEDFDRESAAAAIVRDARPKIVTYDGKKENDADSSYPQGGIEESLAENGFEINPIPDPDPSNNRDPWLP
jgi:hypothetical protein